MQRKKKKKRKKSRHRTKLRYQRRRRRKKKNGQHQRFHRVSLGTPRIARLFGTLPSERRTRKRQRSTATRFFLRACCVRVQTHSSRRCVRVECTRRHSASKKRARYLGILLKKYIHIHIHARARVCVERK